MVAKARGAVSAHGAEPKSRPASGARRHDDGSDILTPRSVPTSDRLANDGATRRREREPIASAETSEEPVELTRTQERTLEDTEVGELAPLLREELKTLVKMCMGADPDAPLAVDERIELYFELGAHRGEARVESVSYGEHSESDDPRLLECLHEILGGDILPAEVLDVVDGGALMVRLGPPVEQSDDA